LVTDFQIHSLSYANQMDNQSIKIQIR